MIIHSKSINITYNELNIKVLKKNLKHTFLCKGV